MSDQGRVSIEQAILDAHHLQELIDLEEGYWWHVAKRRLAGEILQRYLPAPGLLVEGGIGSGRNLLEFQRLGYEVAGLDIMPESVARARQVGLPNVHLHDLTEPWPIAAGTVRAVVMLDVLEHVPDPIRTLSHAVAALREDGGVVITVPAYPRLYSQWDKKLGHYRRYTRSELLRQTAAAGLQPVYEGHWNSFSVPAGARVAQAAAFAIGRRWCRVPASPACSEPAVDRLCLRRTIRPAANPRPGRPVVESACLSNKETDSVPATNPRPHDPLVSVVLPCFNEARVLERLTESIVRALDRGENRYEIVYVNDGSTDDSVEVLDGSGGRESGDPRGPFLAEFRAPGGRPSGAGARPR